MQKVALIVIEFYRRTTPVWKSIKPSLDEDDSNGNEQGRAVY